MSNAGRQDPYANFSFRVEIDGVPLAGFTEVSGLVSESEVISYREGADLAVRRIPGQTTFAPIVLKRGITNDRTLWEWRKQIADGVVDRRSGTIVLLDGNREAVARWVFRQGWPSKWIGPVLNGQQSDVAIETLEIVHEGLDWVS